MSRMKKVSVQVTLTTTARAVDVVDYVRDAVLGYSGGYPIDHPMFGVTRGNVRVRKTRSPQKRKPS